MRNWLKRFAFYTVPLLLLAPLGASAVTPPTVLTATPGLMNRQIGRFTLRFSEAMTPLGKFFSAIIAFAGVMLIALPTGILAASDKLATALRLARPRHLRLGI